MEWGAQPDGIAALQPGPGISSGTRAPGRPHTRTGASAKRGTWEHLVKDSVTDRGRESFIPALSGTNFPPGRVGLHLPEGPAAARPARHHKDNSLFLPPRRQAFLGKSAQVRKLSRHWQNLPR